MRPNPQAHLPLERGRTRGETQIVPLRHVVLFVWVDHVEAQQLGDAECASEKYKPFVSICLVRCERSANGHYWCSAEGGM